MMRTVALFIFGTPLARLFDLNGEVNRVRKKHNRVIIAGDVRRFGHVINKDGVLGTHNHLFVGSDGGSARWATVCSLSATAKLNNVEPFSVASWNIAHSSDASSSES